MHCHMHSCHMQPPCRWAFSIWGLIFLLQGAGVVYQALELWYEDRASTTLLVEAIGGPVPCLSPGFQQSFVQPQVQPRCFTGYWWVLGWIAECAWQFFFQQQSRTALWICMLCLLGGLFSFANAVTNLYRLLPHKAGLSHDESIHHKLPTNPNIPYAGLRHSMAHPHRSCTQFSTCRPA